MNCCFCRRSRSGEWLSDSWKTVGGAFLCRQCRRRRYRLRSFAAMIVEPDGAAWDELRPTLQESRSRLIPRDEFWEASITDGQPVVRILVRHRWCELRLQSVTWSSGKRVAYESVASGEAGGELFLFRVPAGDKIMCRMVAWLPRNQVEDANRPQAALPDWAGNLDLSMSQLEEINVRDLRRAIRANVVSFPSQVPAFQKHEKPELTPRTGFSGELSRRIAQLYFVSGWHCIGIGTRYGFSENRVRQILNAWKCRAVEAGYIQHIPPADVISHRGMAKENRPTSIRPSPRPHQ
jgi:hypothetical protein